MFVYLTGPFWKILQIRLMPKNKHFLELLWQYFYSSDDLTVIQPTSSEHWRTTPWTRNTVGRLLTYWASKISGSRPWPFRVTWRHLSRGRWDSWCAVSYRWSFETIALSRIVVEILCVKHLAKHIPIDYALIPTFVLGSKIGVTAFCNFVLVAAPYRHVVWDLNCQNRSTGLVTAVFGHFCVVSF